MTRSGSANTLNGVSGSIATWTMYLLSPRLLQALNLSLAYCHCDSATILSASFVSESSEGSRSRYLVGLSGLDEVGTLPDGI